MRNITRHLLAVAGAVALTASTAGAQLVQYNTTGSFNGTASNVFTCGTTGSLTFVGVAAAAGDGSISYGEIDAKGSCPSLNGTTFTLNVAQTAPSAGTDYFAGMLTGTFSTTSSGTFLDFTRSTIQLGNSIYTVDSHVRVVSPSTNNGVTTIQGSLTTTPEPASMTLLATGLIGILGAARRKRNATTV